MMALDYVRALREETSTGGDVLRPAVKMSAEEIAQREATARAIEHENGRYGRFRDQQGNWAWAWQAHGPKTPLIPPRFIEPAGRIRRMPTGELVLEGAGREQPALIEPQSWVVVYEGQPDEAIVATDVEFRNVMTPENRVQGGPDAPEQGQAMDDRPAPENAPRAAPAPTNMVPNVSIDGFVAQVLIDNARLRSEIAIAQQQRDDAWRAQRDRDVWKAAAEQHLDRLSWLWKHVTKAMGDEGPPDYDIEAFLADAGRMYREHLAAVETSNKEVQRVAELTREPQEPPLNHVTDLPPEASAPVQPVSKRAPLNKPKS
jgi:hypothetical protein